MAAPYPLSVDDQRSYPPGFDGPVFVWDIDKTYLDTRFSSMRGLARIPIEFAIDKQAIPGMPEVLRGIRRGPGPGFACAPLYFVSASPPQMRKVLERKMLLDGVEHDGITFKDWASTLRALRPGRLREHVGFKLCALLTGRIARPLSREYLFGDDAESDAAAFHLYARLVSRELRGGDAVAAMADLGVRPDDRRCARDLLDRLASAAGPRCGRVERAYIRVERETSAADLARLAPLVTPVRDAAELAQALHAEGVVDEATVREATEAVARGRQAH